MNAVGLGETVRTLFGAVSAVNLYRARPEGFFSSFELTVVEFSVFAFLRAVTQQRTTRQR
jgi:hypothetical protein